MENALRSSELRERYPELSDPSERTKETVELFKEIARESREKGWGVAFISGLAVDAHFGYLTRNHRDVDLMALREAMSDIKSFLESKKHIVTDPGKIKGDSFKVDATDPDHPSWSRGDIHRYSIDEKGNVIIPHGDKELKFSGSIDEITEELSFFGESARFLKPQYLLEEKAGWVEQIGLENEERNKKEMEKIKFLIESRGVNE